MTPRGSLEGGHLGEVQGLSLDQLGHIKFEMPMRHLSEDIALAVRQGRGSEERSGPEIHAWLLWVGSGI